MKLSYLPSSVEDWTEWWDVSRYHWFSNSFSGNLIKELTVVLPDADDGCALNLPEDSCLNDVYHAWRQIKALIPGTQLQAWRVIHKYGDEIAPNLGVFRIRESPSLCFFWLSPYYNKIETQSRLADLLPTMSAYWHIMQGRGLFHAAGILHKKNGYLFAGASGAGKSTISGFSKEQGDKIIHDDHVVIYQGEDRRWFVSDASYSVSDSPIKAILFLVQDHEDRLFPISTARTVKGLMKSLDEHGKHALFGDVYQSAFSTCSGIARCIPSYELHFRKSADFWKLIDEQFPD